MTDHNPDAYGILPHVNVIPQVHIHGVDTTIHIPADRDGVVP